MEKSSLGRGHDSVLPVGQTLTLSLIVEGRVYGSEYSRLGVPGDVKGCLGGHLRPDKGGGFTSRTLIYDSTPTPPGV